MFLRSRCLSALIQQSWLSISRHALPNFNRIEPNRAKCANLDRRQGKFTGVAFFFFFFFHEQIIKTLFRERFTERQPLLKGQDNKTNGNNIRPAKKKKCSALREDRPHSRVCGEFAGGTKFAHSCHGCSRRRLLEGPLSMRGNSSRGSTDCAPTGLCCITCSSCSAGETSPGKFWRNVCVFRSGTT